MKKMNKKGFTLIEMLVVIAIIAILVAIIIPTVMSSTNKAEASTIAANLRSLKAEISTSILTKAGPWAGVNLEADADPLTLDADQTAAVQKAFPDDSAEVTIHVDGDTETFVVKYDGKTINEWAAEAGGTEKVGG